MIRRFLTRILMVILIAACGYNAWQVQQLQQEVRGLQAHASVRAENGPNETSVSSPAGRNWLGQADLHAARARSALMRADLPTAQRELQRGVDDVHHAVQEPEEKTQATLKQARGTLTSLQGEADALWRKVHAVPSAP